MLTPTFEDARKYVSDYDLVPVKKEIYSDIKTPIEVLRILKGLSGHVFMLESVENQDRWGRYTFMGYDPKMEITCKDNELVAGDLKVTTDKPDEI